MIRVLFEEPGYEAAAATLACAGVELLPLPVDEQGANLSAAPSLDAKALYVTPSHQFPLGLTLSMPRRLALIDWAQRQQAYLIEDDYDSEFRYDGPPLTALQGMDPHGRVLYLDSFAKTLFPGLRLGFAVVPNALLPSILAIRHASDRMPSSLALDAVADLIEQGAFAAHLRRARRKAEISGRTLAQTLNQCQGPLRAAMPKQGLHLVANLPQDYDDICLALAAQRLDMHCLPLSPLYRHSPVRRGLILGFSGYGPDELAASAQRLQALARDLGAMSDYAGGAPNPMPG